MIQAHTRRSVGVDMREGEKAEFTTAWLRTFDTTRVPVSCITLATRALVATEVRVVQTVSVDVAVVHLVARHT